MGNTIAGYGCNGGDSDGGDSTPSSRDNSFSSVSSSWSTGTGGGGGVQLKVVTSYDKNRHHEEEDGDNDVKQGDSSSSDRYCVRGSPVVPGSAQKIVKEGEYSLYTIIMLKGITKVGPPSIYTSTIPLFIFIETHINIDAYFYKY